MMVLMFGWEFPPNIYGGLGTACYGLRKGLSKVKDMEGPYVVAKIFGGKNKSKIKLIGAINGSVINRKVNLKEFGQSIQFIERCSKLVPFIHPEVYRPKITCRVYDGQPLIELGMKGKVIFKEK